MTANLVLSVRVFVREAHRPAIAYLLDSPGIPGWPWARAAAAFPDLPGVKAWAGNPHSAWIPFSIGATAEPFDVDHGLWQFTCSPRTTASAMIFADTVLRPLAMRADYCRLQAGTDPWTDLIPPISRSPRSH